jgi:hypothetical protein
MLTRDVILSAFDRLSCHLASRGVVGEIALGGTAMMFAFQARQATKDLDAIFSPAKEVREAAKIVGAELNLPEDWSADIPKRRGYCREPRIWWTRSSMRGGNSHEWAGEPVVPSPLSGGGGRVDHLV